MKKIIAVFLIVSIVFCFVGCNVFSHEKPQDDSIQNENKKVFHNGIKKAVDSYDDLLRAWNMINDNDHNFYSLTPYVVKNDPDGRFKVVYYFYEDNRNAYYPISFDDFFTNESYGLFVNKIYLLDMSGNDCLHEDSKYSNDPFAKYSHMPFLYEEDEDYEKFKEYEEYPVINLAGSFAVQIEDRSLVSIVETKSDNTYRYGYDIYYSKQKIITVDSCVPIDENLLNVILDNLVILK